MHSARKAFVEAESSDKIKRALAHNVRSSEEVYASGDKVFFKRNAEKRWLGPGRVIGQDGKQVVVKFGGQIYRVHTSRLTHCSAFPDLASDSNEIDAVCSSETQNNTTKQTIEAEECSLLGDEEPLLNQEIDEQEQPFSSHAVDVKPVLHHEVDEQILSGDGVANRDTDGSDARHVVFPKVKSSIMFKLKNDDTWTEGFVHSRAGKAGGVYDSCFNIQKSKDSAQWHDFKKEVEEWEPVPENVLISTTDKSAMLTAKLKEIENCRRNDVFSEFRITNSIS